MSNPQFFSFGNMFGSLQDFVSTGWKISFRRYGICMVRGLMYRSEGFRFRRGNWNQISAQNCSGSKFFQLELRNNLLVVPFLTTVESLQPKSTTNLLRGTVDLCVMWWYSRFLMRYRVPVLGFFPRSVALWRDPLNELDEFIVCRIRKNGLHWLILQNQTSIFSSTSSGNNR